MAQDLRGANRPIGDSLPAAARRRPLIVVQPARLWLADTEVWECLIHWDQQRQRSSMCGYFAGSDGCEGCDTLFLPRRWINMVQVQDERQRAPVRLMNVTPLALKDCPRLTGADPVLPWTLALVWREPARASGRMRLKLLPGGPPPYRPELHSTGSLMLHLFGAADRYERAPGPRLHRPRPEDDAPGVGDPANDTEEGGGDEPNR